MSTDQPSSLQKVSIMLGEKPRSGIFEMAASLLALLLLVCGNAAAQDPTPISSLEVKFRKQIYGNDLFKAYLLEIPPHQASLMHRHDTDILSVFVSGGETRGTFLGKPPKVDTFAVGEVRFRPAGFTHSTENIGEKTFRSVILEFSSSMGAIEPGKPADSHYCNPDTATACVDVKHVLCTARLCVQDVGIAPGAIWHNDDYASDQLLVAVSDYKLPNASKRSGAKVRVRKSGEVEYFPRKSVMQWRNDGNEPARVVTIVFRKPD